MDSQCVQTKYGTNGVGRNPTDRGRLATKVGPALDDNGILIAASCHGGQLKGTSTIQNALIPIRDFSLYGDNVYDSRTVKRTLVCSEIFAFHFHAPAATTP